MQSESISLGFKQGSSDKVYHVNLKEENDGWLVNFAYGRRGKPLKHGTKTAKPLPYDQAKYAYDKLVNEKMAKGYTTDASGAPFVGSKIDQERTGWLPQLLTPIEKENLSEVLVRFPTVALQTKHDGERRIIICKDNNIIGSNRRGLAVPLHEKVHTAFERCMTALNLDSLVVDTEDMGEFVVIFDVLEYDGTSLITWPFKDRADYLWNFRSPVMANSCEFLRTDIPEYSNRLNLLEAFVTMCEKHNEEGVVLRDPEAPYTPGRPNSWGPCLKLKFYATATCWVGNIHPTKRSIALMLMDEDGNPRDVGNCTIPPNYEIPNLGDLVEIKYLYAYKEGSIYQPQYKGVRTDLEQQDAALSQLKYKE